MEKVERNLLILDSGTKVSSTNVLPSSAKALQQLINFVILTLALQVPYVSLWKVDTFLSTSHCTVSGLPDPRQLLQGKELSLQQDYCH